MDFSAKYSEDILIDMFLDWLNDFLSVERFAEYYGIGEVEALWAIQIGGDLHEASCINEGE